MKTCETCHHDRERYSESCETCTAFNNWEPMTNADKVRAMDDATLSEVWNHMERSQEEWCEWLKQKTE
jgi:hypothetical protein